MKSCPYCKSDIFDGNHQWIEFQESTKDNVTEVWKCPIEGTNFRRTLTREEFAEQGLSKDQLKRMSLSLFNKLILIDPQDSNTYKSRGIIYYELGNFRQASSDFSSAIDYNPKDGESYLFRGNCSEKLGKKEKALQDYRSAAQKGNETAKEILKSSD